MLNNGVGQPSVSLVKNSMAMPQEIFITTHQVQMYMQTKRPMPTKLQQAWDQEVASKQRKKPSGRSLKYRDTGAVTNISYGKRVHFYTM